MKRLYNKPIMIDTCVAKLILGIQGNNDDIVRDKLNEDTLKKYIKHHGCIMSVFTLFEILRKEDNIDDALIKNLKYYNIEIFTPYTPNKDVFGKNYIEEIRDKEKVILFLDTINKEITSFASKNLSEILTYPMDYLLFALVNHFKVQGIKVNLDKINNDIFLANKIISAKLYDKMLKADYFKKSKILKIVNNAYKWIAYHLFDWFNNEGNDVIKNNNHNELYSALKKLIKRFKSINLEDEMIIQDQSLRADGQCNMLYELCETMKLTNRLIGLNVDELFIQSNKEVIKLIYHSQERNVLNVYLEKNIYDLYLSHIKSKKGQSEPKLKLDKIYDSNDIIDMLSYNFAHINHYKFITTDGNLNGIIKQVENNVDINRIFVKNI